jgi:hypothetical protein
MEKAASEIKVSDLAQTSVFGAYSMASRLGQE